MKSMFCRFNVFIFGVALVLTSCSSGSVSGTSQLPSEAAQSVVQQQSSNGRLTPDSVALSSGAFKITSPTFTNNGTIPKSMIGNLAPQCNGSDLSPVLNWSGQPAGTKSLALVLFDETANFGHWGIYNMRSFANRLPQGVKPGNIAGLWMQVFNDLIYSNISIQGYFGPCPPPGIVHHYVFTIYALDTPTITLQNNAGLGPPNIESLLNAMIGHVIARASITGLLKAP